mgnify:CR=1 FL=1
MHWCNVIMNVAAVVEFKSSAGRKVFPSDLQNDCHIHGHPQFRFHLFLPSPV